MFFKPYYDVDKILEGLQQPMWRVPPNMDGAKALADEIELLRTKLSDRDRELSAVREANAVPSPVTPYARIVDLESELARVKAALGEACGLLKPFEDERHAVMDGRKVQPRDESRFPVGVTWSHLKCVSAFLDSQAAN